MKRHGTREPRLALIGTVVPAAPVGVILRRALVVREVRCAVTAPEVERLATRDAARRRACRRAPCGDESPPGTLRAEQHPRPQGVRYVVLWDPAASCPAVEFDSPQAAAANDGVVPEVERTAWYWWLLFPAVVVAGMTLGRWLS